MRRQHMAGTESHRKITGEDLGLCSEMLHQGP
jgi:hypothetical protein